MASVGQSTRTGQKDLPDPCDEKRELRRMVQELEAENERLRKAAKEAADQIFMSSDGRTLDHHGHDGLIEAGKKLQNALKGGGDADD